WNEFFPRLQSGTEKAFQDYKREWEGRGQKVNANDQTPQAFEIRVENAPAPENHTSSPPAGNTTPPPNARPSYNLGFNFAENQGKAVKIRRVSGASRAARAGLEARDVIVSAGGIRLSSRGELNQAVENSNGTLRLVLRDFRTNKFYYRDLRLERKG